VSGTLFVGDVHGCAAELAALIDLARPDRLILVGDLYTKGPDPLGVWRIIQEQRAEAVLGNHDDAVLRKWSRGRELPPSAFAWLRARPLFLEGPGWLCVHAGIDPSRGPAATSRDQALTLRRWPDGDERSPNPFWWELYQGDALVIYGHDARRGLMDRRPRTLGLDTGCVYGGALSGYLLEEGRILRVPAARCYSPPKG